MAVGEKRCWFDVTAVDAVEERRVFIVFTICIGFDVGLVLGGVKGGVKRVWGENLWVIL